MISVLLGRVWQWLAIAMLAVALTACGGGGGSPGTQSGSAAPPPPAVPTMGIGLFGASGSAVTTLSENSVTFVAVKLVNGAGTPVSGVVVTFSAENAALVRLLPTTGTALTDKDGLASIQVAPAPGTPGGATYFRAQTTLNGATVESQNLGVTVLAAQPLAVVQPTMSVSVVNPTGATATNVLFGGGQVARAEVRDGQGRPVANRLVTFSVAPVQLVALNPLTALTNAQGIATVAMNPVSISALGAGRVEAQAQVDTQLATGGFDFAVQAVSLSLSPIRFGSVALASAAETSVGVDALISGSLASGVPISVLFTASCGRLNEVDAIRGISVGTDGNSRATVVYRSIAMDGSPCRGRVNFSAVTTGAPAQQGAVTVSEPIANAVNFVGATPNQIFVAGSGAQEQSVVVFRALAGTTPLQDVQVRFTIATNPGGAGLGVTGGTQPIVVNTNSSGEARVTVFAGSIPGPLKVRATLVADSNVFSETQNLSVSSGPPSQRFMSLAVETFNIEGWNRDGSGTRLTVRLADRQGNPVENGTVVNFTAEGGQVQSSCATLVTNGVSACSVSFESQNPRPAGGRASVLAYVAGTKDYIDVNGNNRYDAGVDTLVDQGDVYRDDNENGQFDAGEFLVSRGGSAACAGAGAPFPARANTCDGSLPTVVRQQTVILFSSSTPSVTFTSVSTGGVTMRVSSLHNPLIPMPAGTVITAEAIDGTPSNNLSCQIGRVFGTPIPNVSPGTDPAADLATSASVTLRDCAPGDGVVVSVRAPSGLETSFGVQIPTGVAPPPPVIPTVDNLLAGLPSPAQIFVSGNGLTENAVVAFTSRNGTTPIGTQTLRVSLVNNVGGIQIGSRGNSAPVTVVTDSSGRASVPIFSGTIPTTVRLRAELVSDPSIFAEVQSLVITSGPPSQRFFSVSVANPNLEFRDGQATTVSVFAADRQGNPVPDGTRINLTSESGQVASPCATTVGASGIVGVASCSVQYVIQEPRLPAGSDGRVSILVYAEGTKDYTDVNGNNRFDSGDVLANMGDAFRDDNEDGLFNSGEFVVPRAVTGGTCFTTGSPAPSVGSTCDATLNTTVRKQMELYVVDMSAPPVLTLVGSSVARTLSGVTSREQVIQLNAGSHPNAPLASGSSLSATLLNAACGAVGFAGGDTSIPRVFPPRDRTVNAGSLHTMQLSGCNTTTPAEVRVIVTSPSGLRHFIETTVNAP